MSNLEMDIYTATTGVQITVKWENEDEYQLGKKFLTDMGASCGSRGKMRVPDQKPEFFYLENAKQLEALFRFMRSLNEKARRAE
jgi:hypothetical protein